jgi:hypothetical protein
MGTQQSKYIRSGGKDWVCYSFGYVAERTGLNVGSLRRWEGKGHVEAQFKDDQQRRWFTKDYVLFLRKMVGDEIPHYEWPKEWKTFRTKKAERKSKRTRVRKKKR